MGGERELERGSRKREGKVGGEEVRRETRKREGKVVEEEVKRERQVERERECPIPPFTIHSLYPVSFDANSVRPELYRVYIPLRFLQTLSTSDPPPLTFHVSPRSSVVSWSPSQSRRGRRETRPSRYREMRRTLSTQLGC